MNINLRARHASHTLAAMRTPVALVAWLATAVAAAARAATRVARMAARVASAC